MSSDIASFPEIGPDDDESFVNGLADITSRWRADEITSGQATAEIRALRTRS